MKRFTSGLVAGGLIGIMGAGWLMSDDKTRKRITRDSKRALRKAEHFFDGVTDMF